MADTEPMPGAASGGVARQPTGALASLPAILRQAEALLEERVRLQPAPEGHRDTSRRDAE